MCLPARGTGRGWSGIETTIGWPSLASLCILLLLSSSTTSPPPTDLSSPHSRTGDVATWPASPSHPGNVAPFDSSRITLSGNLEISPSPRINTGPRSILPYAMDFSPPLKESILFADRTGETWAYGAGSWTNLTPSLGQAPPPGGPAFMAWDPGDGGMLLLDTVSGLAASQTWLFKSGTWSNLSTNQSALFNSSFYSLSYGLTTDSADNAVLMFGGGFNNGTTAAPTWEFKAGLWHLLSPKHEPPGRKVATVSDDPADAAVLLFGGYNVTNNVLRVLNDTWLFKGGDWVQVTRSTRTPALFAANAAPEGNNGPIVMWGGLTQNYTTYPIDNNETWSFSNGSWTQVAAKGRYPVAALNATNEAESINVRGLDDRADGYVLYAWNLSVMAGFRNGAWALVPMGGILNANSQVYVGGALRFEAIPVGGFGPVRCSFRFEGTVNAGGSGCIGAETAATPGSGILSVWLNDSANESVQFTTGYSVYLPLRILGAVIPSKGDAEEPLGFTVNFSGGAVPVSVRWVFGDGDLSYFANSTHAYVSPGNYTVRLILTDGLKSLANATGVVDVHAFPLVRVGLARLSVDVNESLGVNVTVGSGFGPYSLSLAFGDGGTYNASGVATNWILIRHAYARTGSYAIQANLTDQEMRQATNTATIQVNPPLKLLVRAPAPREAPGFPVLFDAQVTGGSIPYTAKWTFGDGGTGTGPTPTHNYTAGGVYRARVNVTDAAGVEVSGATNVTVVPAPPATRSGGWNVPEIAASVGIAAILIALASVLLIRRRQRPDRSLRPESNREGESDGMVKSPLIQPESRPDLDSGRVPPSPGYRISERVSSGSRIASGAVPPTSGTRAGGPNRPSAFESAIRGASARRNEANASQPLFCLNCNREFEPTSSVQKFCSYMCRRKYTSVRRKLGVEALEEQDDDPKTRPWRKWE